MAERRRKSLTINWQFHSALHSSSLSVVKADGKQAEWLTNLINRGSGGRGRDDFRWRRLLEYDHQ